MSAAERSREKLRARRAALRGRLKRQRPEKRGRRWGCLLLLLLLILLLLLRDCSCAGVPDAPVGPESMGAPSPAEPVEPEPPVAPITGRLGPIDRPDFRPEPPDPLAWIDAFRMSVAARSPRLAQCFVGANSPGTLKWTTSVEPVAGLVSDHSLEPMLMGAELTSKERGCVIAVLSDPPYSLPVEEGRATPSRVGLVLEF